MILLERRKTVLRMAVRLKDETSSDQRPIGNVFLIVSEVGKKPIEHLSTGYFLFINLPEGTYNIRAGGEFYEETDFMVDTGSLNPNLPVVDLTLEPKA